MNILIKKFDTVTSTNDIAKCEAESGAAEGTVILADTQTCGRGRMGRSFLSPTGGLYMSMILYPKTSSDAIATTTRAAVSVAHAIEKHTKCACQIKWVNDIFQNGKKVCGILAEAQTSGNNITYTVLGIGINLKNAPAELSDIAGCIGDIPREDLVYDIADEFFNGSWNCFEEYSKRDMLHNKKVTVYRSGNALYTATATGITEDFGLSLMSDDGSSHVLYSGEVSVKES